MGRIIQNTEFGETKPGFSPRAMSLATATAALEPADEGGSASEKRNILLFGYWPPTDKGNMLAEWKGGLDVDKYHVQSFSPTWPQNKDGKMSPLGWDKLYVDYGNGAKIPWWGPGQGGDLSVDYLITSGFFWKKVRETKPIAIMSFSRFAPLNLITKIAPVSVGWWLEPTVWNLGQNLWGVVANYPAEEPTQPGVQYFPGYYTNPSPADAYPPPRGGAGAASVQVLPAAWTPPLAGGGAGDESPFGPGKEYPKPPKPGNPPDPTEDAVIVWPPVNGVPAATRSSSLPMGEIIDAIKAKLPASKVDPALGNPGTLGDFVSHYMAYHVCWYKAYSDDYAKELKEKTCKKAGHTHVASDILPDDAKAAVKVQLGVLIEELNKLNKP